MIETSVVPLAVVEQTMRPSGVEQKNDLISSASSSRDFEGLCVELIDTYDRVTECEAAANAASSCDADI